MNSKLLKYKPDREITKLFIPYQLHETSRTCKSSGIIYNTHVERLRIKSLDGKKWLTESEFLEGIKHTDLGVERYIRSKLPWLIDDLVSLVLEYYDVNTLVMSYIQTHVDNNRTYITETELWFKGLADSLFGKSTREQHLLRID